MKRLLALLGLTSLVVLTACFYLGETFAVILGVSAGLLFFLAMFIPFARKEGTYPVAFITAVIAVCMFLGYTNFYVNPIKAYAKTTAEITAVQQDYVYHNNGYYNYILKVKSIAGKKVDTKMRLCSKQALFTEPYDELKFTADLSFTDNKSYYAQKIFLQAYFYSEEDVEVTKPDSKPLMYYIKSLRKDLSTALYLEMDYDTAAFSSAILLGDKNALEPDAKELLRSAGLSHIAVVSGLHLSIVGAIFAKIFDKTFRNTYLSGTFTILVIIVFALLCGFGVPVIRAGIMLIILNIGKMIGRRWDSLNSIGFAALLLSAFNPYCPGDVGMLLSFASTLGIIFWGDKLTYAMMQKLSVLPFLKFRILYRFLKTIISTIAVSLSATIWTLPIIMLTYNGVSTVSVFTNLLIVPLMYIVISLIALCILTHYVSFLAVLCDFLAQLVSAFYSYIVSVCESFTALAHSYVYTDKTYFYVWLCLSFVLAAIAVLIGRKSVTVLAVMLSVLILFTGSMNYRFAWINKLTIHSLDTGKGLTIVLEGSDGYAVLCAGGSKSRTYILSNKLETMYSNSQTAYIDIPGNNSQIFCDNLINAFDYTAVLRYDNKSDTDYVTTDENAVWFSDIHSLELWGKAEVIMIPADEAVFEYIKAGDTEVLVVPRDSDCSVLPYEYTTADIIITDGIPNDYELLSCDTLYVTGSGYVADATEKVLRSVCNKVIRDTDFSFDIDIS